MATIRIPASAEPLLPFCRTSGTPGPHIWETYADMVVFLAANGYKTDGAPPANPTPLKTANPIDMGVFRSRNLYPILLTIALADQRNWQITKNADQIASIIEKYASAGASELCPTNMIPNTTYLEDILRQRIQDSKNEQETLLEIMAIF